MPSPFPGMDPYLEGSLWLSVHHELSSEFVRQLTPKLRPRYVARSSRRFVVAIPEGVVVETASIFPDVSVARRTVRPPPASGTAIAAAPLRMATVMPEAVPHVTIEIRDTASRHLVTAIEVLSPYNKRGEGREEYLTKRARILNSTAHLLEIDLLREGQRLPMRQPLPPAPYFIFLSRASERPLTEVWPVALDHPLPTVPVPLLPGDQDAPLDLQEAFANVYDLCGYDLEVDYGMPPEVRLGPEEAAWASKLLESSPMRGDQGRS